MPQLKSLRTRFALWTTCLLLSILAIFGTFVYANISRSLRASLDANLSWSASQAASSLTVKNGHILVPGPVSQDEIGKLTYGAGGPTLVVLARDGSVLQADGVYSQVSLPPPGTGTAGEFTSLPLPGKSTPLRVYTLPVLEGGQVVGWVQTMQSLQPLTATLRQLLLLMVLGGSLPSFLAGLGGYFLSAHVLASIDAITRTAARISSEDLSARLKIPDTVDEVSRLATTFNGLLARLERSFQRERQFNADASHELRTPLAAMQSILAVMRQGVHPIREYRAALDDLAKETSRLHALVEDLLRLARAESASRLHPEALDLAVVLADVAETLRPLAVSKGLSLTCKLPDSLPFTGDMDALIRLFVNLLDNAIKYTHEGGVILSACCDGESTRVEVTDTGIGIPAEHLPFIFERFYRVEPTRSAGSTGLGLAIARQLARSVGGRIDVRSVLGSGTTFTVIFPLEKTRPSAA
jgi:signal transduction histidine kinase